MAEYKAAHPAPVKPVKATVPVTPSNGMKAAKLAQLGRTVNGARGERHNTLLKMARLGGGYIAGEGLTKRPSLPS